MLSIQHGLPLLHVADTSPWQHLEVFGLVKLNSKHRQVTLSGFSNPQTSGNSFSGRLGDLELRRSFVRVPSGVEETIAFHNAGTERLRIESALFGVSRMLCSEDSSLLEEARVSRWVSMPFRPAPWEEGLQEWSVEDLLRSPGRRIRLNKWLRPASLPDWQHQAEGFAWEQDSHCLAVMTGNDSAIQFGALAALVETNGVRAAIGAGLPGTGQPGACLELEPGQSVHAGVIRYQILEGGHPEGMIAYRAWLDERGHRFPVGYHPPLQWNELYDNPEWSVSTGHQPETGWLGRRTRSQTFTLESLWEEAAKARDFGCETLYLDPGWDTAFGSMIWDENRLGPLKDFIEQLRADFGLSAAFHIALAPWVGRDGDPSSTAFPAEALRQGTEPDDAAFCFCSSQYLETALRRCMELCEAGAVFLMLDGNFWTGACHSPSHGHPVPSSYADHIAANYALARRIKEKYPEVFVELHAPIADGARTRWAPVYFGYDRGRGFDENWGFELMWDPFADLREGRARARYYYCLACNIPAYLHIDLRDDNEHATVFWWFASTCRHLGIGGTHANPNVVTAQKSAAQTYRQLARFFNEGEFHGLSEEIHVHVLPGENQLVVNIFNLSDETRRITGRAACTTLGIDPKLWYSQSRKGAKLNPLTAELEVDVLLPPWGSQIVTLRIVPPA